MPKGYWIVNIEVNDADQYAEYAKRVRPFLAEFGAKFIVRGGQSQIVEGSVKPRNVVIEFASYQQAVDVYHSPEYQAIMAYRSKASSGDFVIIEGHDA